MVQDQLDMVFSIEEVRYMRNRIFISISLLIGLIVLTTACGGKDTSGPTNNSPTNTPEEAATTKDTPEPSPTDVIPTETTAGEDTSTSSGETDFLSLVADNSIMISRLFSNADEETSGPILTIALINQSNDELTITIPCGLVFSPDSGEEQPLMVIEPVEVTLLPGEEAEILLNVVCEDISVAAPSRNTTYSIGTFTDIQKMQELVDCICDTGFDTTPYSMDWTNVQFAVWYTQMGGDPAAFIEEHKAELPEDFQAEFAGSPDTYAAFISMFESFATPWIDACSIEFEE